MITNTIIWMLCISIITTTAIITIEEMYYISVLLIFLCFIKLIKFHDFIILMKYFHTLTLYCYHKIYYINR